MTPSKVLGWGKYLPSKILSNFDLEKVIHTTNEWIESRTGIKQRHIAAEGELCSDMGYAASIEAIKNARIKKEDIDLIIVCSSTPDNTFPATAVQIQAKLDIGNIPAFDVQGVCAGFIYGLKIADNFIKTDSAKCILLVSVEKFSNIVDWEDRSSCILFGDGASAVIVGSGEGIIDINIFSDGKYKDILYTDGGVALNKQAGKIKMKGPEVYKHAIEKMEDAITQLLIKNNLTINDIDYFVPHQANIRIIKTLAEKFNFPWEKVIVTIDKHANCSAASIPLAISEEQNKFKSGDVILMSAIGAGLVWGAALMKW